MGRSKQKKEFDKPRFNYLDLQLRIMKKRGNEITAVSAMIDKNSPNETFQYGWNLAWTSAEKWLDDLYKTGGENSKDFRLKNTNSKLLDNLYSMLIDAQKKEQEFAKELIATSWENGQIAKNESGRIKINYTNLENLKKPSVHPDANIKDYKWMEITYRNYVYKFSKFIMNTIYKSNSQSDIILDLFNSQDYAEAIAGKSSKIYSTFITNRVLNKTYSTRDGEQIKIQQVNDFYTALFDLFFFKKPMKQNQINLVTGLASIEEKRKSTITKYSLFNNQFQNFLKSFLPEFYEALNQFQLEDSMVATAFEKVINRNGGGKQWFNLSHNNKGVTFATEQGLKKLLLYTIKELIDKQASKRGITYEKLKELSEGRFVITEGLEQTDNALIKEFKIDIKNAKKANNNDKNAKEKLKESFKKVLLYGAEKLIGKQRNEYGEVFEQRHIKKIKNEIEKNYNFIWDVILSTIKINKEKNISVKEASAAQVAEVLDTYGPSQFKGLLGEIRTALILKKGGFKTAMTGKLKNNSGSLHYDVMAQIGSMNIGFQVKNFSGEGTHTLYNTSFSFDAKNTLKKYIPYDENNPKSDGSMYRFLLANGKLIESFNGTDVKPKLQAGLYNYTQNFLRIADANANDLTRPINSDIFVLGNTFVPASYLIFEVMKQVVKELSYKGDKEKDPLFKIDGNYPKAERKVYHKKKKNLNYKDFVNKELVFLNGNSKRRKLIGNRVEFAGITVDFNFDLQR